LGGAAAKLRQINPALAKESAQSGVGGVKDVMQLAVSYAKQETVEPLKDAGRYAAFGVAAAMLIGTGLVLVMLGALRGIQLLTGATDDKRGGLDGSWSWAPYLIAVAVCLVVIGGIVTALRRSLRTGGTSR
jgi:hypothetical protein